MLSELGLPLDHNSLCSKTTLSWLICNCGSPASARRPPEVVSAASGRYSSALPSLFPSTFAGKSSRCPFAIWLPSIHIISRFTNCAIVVLQVASRRLTSHLLLLRILPTFPEHVIIPNTIEPGMLEPDTVSRRICARLAYLWQFANSRPLMFVKLIVVSRNGLTIARKRPQA